MNENAALNIGMDAIRHLKKEHKDELDKLAIWDKAIEKLQAMQMGLDSEGVEDLQDARIGKWD